MNKFGVLAFAFFTTLAVILLVDPAGKCHPICPEPPPVAQPIALPPVVKPDAPNISNPVPGYQNYSQIKQQLAEWHSQAKGLTEIGTYGKSSRGETLYFIRITNKLKTEPKPKVLITSCIHGNESHATSTLMAYMGTLLSEYGKNEEATRLIDTRDIYFIPVVSPDSYPHSRHVDGVDPNRDFPTTRNQQKTSVPPVQALRDFFLEHKFKAVLSGHTWGRWVLYPHGDRNQTSPHDAQFRSICGQMGESAQYVAKQLNKLYNQPIYGAEADWYYSYGAFAVVFEIGTHQRIPSDDETMSEFKRVKRALSIFIEKAPVAF